MMMVMMFVVMMMMIMIIKVFIQILNAKCLSLHIEITTVRFYYQLHQF